MRIRGAVCQGLLGAWIVATCSACAGSEGDDTEKLGAPSTMQPMSGAGGSQTTGPSGMAGSSTPPPPPPSMAGRMGGGAAGMSSGASGTSAAGDGGSGSGAGGMVAEAGSGGTGGSTPQAGGGAPPPSGDCTWARGEAPTEASATAKGPYKVESYTTGFMRASGVDSSTVWYPTDAEPPFAGIAVVPGFVSPESSIRNWGPFLASHGIVAVTIGVPGGDQPDARARKLLGTIDSLKMENTRSGSPLMGKIATNCMALSGWSMGGGGTLIAASMTPELKAAMSFAAWGPRGGAMNKVPVLMFEATADALAASMSDSYYAAVPDTVPKMLFEVQGSSHNVANDPANHNGIIGRYGLSWMKVFLENDTRYRQFLTAGFPSITTSKSATNVK